VSERRTYVEVDGVVQPAPAPRFGRAHGEVTAGTYLTGDDADEFLGSWGLPSSVLAEARSGGSLA